MDINKKEIKDIVEINKYKLIHLKDRPEYKMTDEKMKKWLERKPEGFIVPVPIPHLRECLK